MGHATRTWSAVCSATPHFNLVKEQGHICAWTNEIANTSQQAIELNPSCLGQAHSNSSGTGPGYENTEPGCILTILRVPSIVCPNRSSPDQQSYLKNSTQLAQTGV